MILAGAIEIGPEEGGSPIDLGRGVGLADRQARLALEAALIAEELATMRRATWYGRLLRWRRQTDEAQV